MDASRLRETIIAVSTPPGPGGLGVVRLSGKDSLAIAQKLFDPIKKDGNITPKTAVLGHIFDRESGRKLDEAFLLYFPGPRSYTREDMVEISCHGSPAVLEETVRLGVRSGASPAQPGEFTLRAFLHGRIDILQAEAVQSLIQSTSLEQAQISFGQVRGELSQSIEKLRAGLIQLMAFIEARIEFADDVENMPDSRLRELLGEALDQVQTLVDSYQIGRSLLEGVRLVIVGRPNVGKSTLFNALLGKDRAIVTPIAGTTRDFIAETTQWHGKRFQFVDMAGLAQPRDVIEEESIKRGKSLAEEADGILLLLDASQEASDEDLALAAKYSSKKMIMAFNKLDLPRKIDADKVLARAPRAAHLDISALEKTHIDKLREMIDRTFGSFEKTPEVVVLHLRQKLLLEEISRNLSNAFEMSEKNTAEEILAENIRTALTLIGQLTGQVSSDEVLEAVFSNFCVGK